jgi:mRNA-capping enzyme
MENIFKVIDLFRENNPDYHIGIHCTHGFNRTGLIICSYLADRLKWDISAAIEAFGLIRQNGIYRENVVEDLYNKYNPEFLKLNTISIKQPEWHTEE